MTCWQWWPCCFTTPQSPSSSPSRHPAGVSPISDADEAEITPHIDVASSSHSAVSADEEAELDRCLDEVATLIVNKLMEIKGLKLKDDPKEGQETKFSWDLLKINSDRLKDLKEFLDGGMSCAESLHGGNDVTQAVTPILNEIGSYHWITFGLLLVGKTLERWEDVKVNKEECLRLLEEMAGLADILKQIRDLKMQNEKMEALIKEAVERVFYGYLLCCHQMHSSRLRRMLVATHDKNSLSQLRWEIGNTHTKIQSQMGICIYDATTCRGKAPTWPRRIMYPKHAVGIKGQVDEIIKMLDYESDEKALAVVLHNFGGMGKTTLAEAVFSSLEIKDCKYSMVKLFKDTKDVPDIVELQKTIIGDFTQKKPKDVKIQRPQEGQAEIQKILMKSNAFICIDNVLQSENPEELKHLLPHELSSAKKTRLLITSRDSNLVRRNLENSSCVLKVHPVKGIADEHAEDLLREGCRNKLSQIEITELIKMCRGVPLLVKLVASFIKTYEDEDHEKEAYNIVKEMYDQNKSPMGKELSEIFAIDTLEEECKECFFDICCFFVGRSWRMLKKAYGHLLNILRSKALISIERFDGRYSADEMFDEGVVHVHDVLLDTARRLNEETRLHSIDKLREIIDKSDNGREIKIKGLQFDNSRLSISAKHIDQLHDCLRVLDLGGAIVEGQCSSSFPHMKYLNTRCPPLFLLEKMPNLRVLQVDDTIQKLPRPLVQLQYLQLRSLGQYTKNICTLFPSLRSLYIQDCSDLRTLPANIGDLTFLEVLRLENCHSLEELPASFSKLAYLRFLCLEECHSLTSIPDNLFHDKRDLTYLNLSCSIALEELPESICELSKMRVLHLGSCSNLKKLPQGIGRLTSLVELDLSYCSELPELPESICELSKMRVLQLVSCSNLKKLPQGIGRLTSLVELDLSYCSELQELPEGFGNLHSLEFLDLEHCGCLRVLPRGFGCLTFLKMLSMSHCKRLEELCNDFDQLQSLTTLVLEDCPMLRGDCLDRITKLPSLEEVEISRSKHLIKSWLLCYKDYNIININHMHAMYEDLIDGDEQFVHRLVRKDRQLQPIDCHIPMLIITESSTDPDKLEYLKSVLSRVDKKVPVIHFGDRCVDWPQEIEDAIVARATSDSIAFLLWTRCSQRFVEFPNNGSLVYAILPWAFNTFTWKAFGEEDIVRMSTKYLNMRSMYQRLELSRSKECVTPLLKEMMGPRKREDGMAQVKLQISKNGKEVSVEDLEGKGVYIVAFPSTFSQDSSDMNKEEICQECQVAQNERNEVICTKRGDASDEFSQWIMNNIPDCILLESLDSLTVDAIQFLSDHEQHSQLYLSRFFRFRAVTGRNG